VSGRKPKLVAPPGMCDTHMHFYDTLVPSAPGGPALPGDFSVPMYRELQQRLGMSRVIVVQANAYQDDNRVMLDAMKELGAQAKGVAVVKANVAESEIARLTQAGVCGQRIFNLPGGAVNIAAMHPVMARVHNFGWYANIQLDGRELPKYESSIERLPGRFVIDHVGKFLEPVAPDHAAFKALLRLLDTGRCWVKLAAYYETSKSGAPGYDDVALLAKMLIRHAPERMIWASNWPHPSAPADNKPDDADLLDLLLEWAPDEKIRNRILVDNPAELFGYKGAVQ
jgi:D-galactarolactone isomerase